MKTLLAIASCLTMAAADSVLAAEDPISYIERELGAGKKSIVVPPGVYRLTPKGSVYLKLKELNGVAIDFSNVEFVGTVNTRMLDIVNCDDLTLKGLTIDYDPLPFTQARIVDIDAERSWKVKVIEGYPTEGVVKTNGRIQVYGKDSLELVNPLRHRDDSIVKLDDGSFRISGGINRTGELGDIVVMNCFNAEKRSNDAVSSQNCRNLRIENFTLYSSPDNMGFIENGNTKSVYLNCKIDRRAPETDHVKRGVKRLRSLTADAFHCKDDPVGPQIIGCKARYQGDDCVNIAGTYSIVVKSEGDELRVLSLGGGKMLVSGDSIQIMGYDGQCPPDAKIVSVTPDGQCSVEEDAFVRTLSLWYGFYRGKTTPFRWVSKVKLDRELSLPRGSMIISNDRSGNGFLIKDCDFGNIRSRGLLIKASKGVIENNTVSNCWSHGMQISPEYVWAEGGCSSDLKIVGNRLINNKGSAILIGGSSGSGASLPANSHRNITINGNSIASSTRGIDVAGCTGLDISGNTLEIKSKRQEDAILLKNVAAVTQKDNTVKLLPPPVIPKRDFLPKLKSASVGKQLLYEDGKAPAAIEIEGAKSIPFEFTFVNDGTEAAPRRAQAFLHFETEGGERAMDAGYAPLVSTSDWGKGRQVSDSKAIDMQPLKGKTCKLYIGLYYAEDGGDRLKLGNPGQTSDLSLFVGSIKIR